MFLGARLEPSGDSSAETTPGGMSRNSEISLFFFLLHKVVISWFQFLTKASFLLPFGIKAFSSTGGHMQLSSK